MAAPDVALLSVPLALVVVLVASVRGRHRRPLTTALFVGVVVLASVWFADVVVIARDYRDADGFVDCWPHCTAFQEAVGGVFFYGGVTLALAGVLSAIVLVAGPIRRTFARRDGR